MQSGDGCRSSRRLPSKSTAEICVEHPDPVDVGKCRSGPYAGSWVMGASESVIEAAMDQAMDEWDGNSKLIPATHEVKSIAASEGRFENVLDF